MKLRTAVPLFALAAAVLGAGCYIQIDDRHGHGGDHAPQDCPCQDNAECQSGEYCLRGLCRPLPPNATVCSVSAGCGQRETCINGICTERCAKAPDCSAPGCSCEDNFCVGQPGTDGGTAADAGTGTGADAGAPACTQHADCGVDAYCINATCYLGCQNDTGCPASEQCQSGVCQPRPQNTAPSCTSGAHCASGEDCVDGKCSKPCGAQSPCPQGYGCVIGYCTPQAPPAGSGQACVANCDCPAGETCTSGTCQL
jgi:hypothetical protein